MAQDATDRYIDLELDLAKREHEIEHDGASAHFKQAEAFALLTIRSIGLVSAGGVAAVLGFYSANYARLIALPGSIDSLNSILAGLFIALIFGLASAGMGYWSQTLYAESKWQQKFAMQRPFVSATPASERSQLIGSTCRWVAIGSACAGIAVLIWAGLSFLAVVR